MAKSLLPKTSTKKLAKPKISVGTVLNGKIKIKNPKTGKESWRQGRSGMSLDEDGLPTYRNTDHLNQKEFNANNKHPLEPKQNRNLKSPKKTLDSRET